MKSYSNDVATTSSLAEVNDRQTVQIIILRWAVGVTFFVNLGLTLALKFL
jgi:hypothetical protein